MQIILHVGAHRTATTSLQRLLGGQHPQLEAARLAYWGPKRTRGGLFQGLIGSNTAVLPWQVRRTAARIALRAEQVRQDGYRGLLISDENMLGSLRENLATPALYPSAGDRVARVAAGLAAHEIEIAVAIRCYDAWWASVLSFMMMRGGPVPGDRLCERLITQPRRWRHVIADMSRALPEVPIRVWTFEAMGSRPAALAAELTAGALRLPSPAAPSNPAPGIADLRAYLADCGLNPGLIRGRADRFMPFDHHQRALLRAQYADDLAWLRAGTASRNIYFDEPGEKDLATTGQGRGRPDDGEYRRLA